jgi:hypothetical protein
MTQALRSPDVNDLNEAGSKTGKERANETL